MKNPVGEATIHLQRYDSLPEQMAGVERKSELLAAAQGIEGHFRAVVIENHLAGMHFQREAHAAFSAYIEQGVPSPGEFGKAFRDDCRSGTRIRGEVREDRRSAEPAYYADAELLRDTNRRRHFLAGAVPNTVGIALAPNVIGQQSLMARVNHVADRLAHAMIAEDVERQLIARQQFESGAAIIRLAEGALDFKMIVPAAQLHAPRTPFAQAL